MKREWPKRRLALASVHRRAYAICMSTQTPLNSDSPRGLMYALMAYVLWGMLPIYMKALSHIAPTEIIAHRIVWSLPVAFAALLWQGRSAQVLAALRQPRLLAMAGLTASLISVNWLTYVWAVGNGHALDAALGYYINPLFSVALGALLLGEKLDRLRLVAVALSLLAVILLTLQAGKLPVIAVVLTLSFGFYAYCKRRLPLGPNQGFALEVLILFPFAVAGLIWLLVTGRGAFGTGSTFDVLMLLGCGPVTAIPLLLYANAAKLVRLSTIAIMQYLTPTMVFLTAIIVFREPWQDSQQIAFAMIWIALAIYTYALIREARNRRRTKLVAGVGG